MFDGNPRYILVFIFVCKYIFFYGTFTCASTNYLDSTTEQHISRGHLELSPE